MNERFTPGPWFTDTDDLGTWVSNNTIAAPVAKLGKSDRHNTKANARLIAAAPELYELLRKGLEDGDPMNWDEVSELLDRITKAS